MKFWILRVVIYPEIHIEIIRLMVKELAQFDLAFLSYSQKTVIFGHLLKNQNKIVVFWQYLANDKLDWANSFTIGLRISICISGCITTLKIQNFKIWLYRGIYEIFRTKFTQVNIFFSYESIKQKLFRIQFCIIKVTRRNSLTYSKKYDPS